MTDVKPHFVIIGAGISGLALGWFLKERFGNSINLTILEKEKRPGGWIQTHKTAKGFLFEQGPRSCRTAGSGIETLKLVESLALQDQVVTPSLDAKKRFLYLDQQLQPFPHHLLSFLFSPLSREIVSALWREWRIPKGNIEDETIYEFISRRMNSSIAERFIDPLTTGIYAGDIRELSIKSCFPLFYHWEQQHGSILKGIIASKKAKKESQSAFVSSIRKHPIFSFSEGMETLPRTLSHRLSDHLHLECSVKAIHLGNPLKVETEKGSFCADHLFVTISAYQLAGMLKNEEILVRALQGIPYASVQVVNLGWNKKILKHKGFGYLVPAKEREEILGMVWDSSVFPQQNREHMTRIAVMIGRNNQPYSSHECREIAKKALSKHLNINEPFDDILINLASRAIPQYLRGHSQKIEDIQQKVSQLSLKLTLMGTCFHGVSINDCIAKAKQIAISV